MDGDRALLAALRAGEPDAFDRLFNRYSDRVWRFLCRLIGHDAEDVFQETWIAVARHARGLRDDTARLES